MNSKYYDVIIAGGGPAGTTAATLLAQYGHSVLLIERNQHPRFHIGESMLPMIEPVMDRLGIDWSQGNLRKGGAEFIDEATGRSTFFSFEGIYRTFQIERSVFDQKLFDNAVKQGVEAHQQEQVTRVQCSAQDVHVDTDKAEYQGRYFIDATGRNALMGKKHASINKINKLGKFALYKHYKLANTPEAEIVFARGNVQIFLSEIGWIWSIPLVGRRLSVGLVVQKEAPAELKQDALFAHYINASPRMSELLAGAEVLSEVRMEADFSYLNEQRYGQRFACCGDAAGFLDPVFSSGFLFAVKTAELVADQLHQALLIGNEADPEMQNSGDAAYQVGFKTMYLMIERFYCSGIMQNLFFEQDRHPRIKKEIEAILAGDLWQDGNGFQQGLLSGRSRKN
ncbi:MAG: tryptophan 7-halogenase [Methyloprofundus sp.]|nr:tryptophan 7-halogenase [Methyloprofundus sp.]